MRNFHYPGRSAAFGSNGMAATSSPLATLAALDVLRAGGNAVDAAVTASAVLCVSEPHMTGIGGDCFALVGLPDGKVVGINGSGRAAMAADADWLRASGLKDIPPTSIYSVTVPGAIDAWEKLLARHGTMSLGDTLAPAIRLAEAGVPTTPRVAADWTEHADDLKRDAGGFHFLRDGRAPLAGEIMRYPAFAKTLRQIADSGADAFYRGAIAEEMAEVSARLGGLLTQEDFARHRSDWVEPISTDFAGHDIFEIPPNGQGITALIALNILSHTGIRRHEPGSPAYYHLLIEAMKLAWTLRNRHVADPAFTEIPVADLLSEKTAAKLASQIDLSKASGLTAALSQSDTVYLAVVDRNRLAVSFINSVYDGFGSGIVLPKAGFALQNRGACFVTTPGHPNCIAPGKRPLHTIIPAMARKDGQIDMAFGVMGGDYQPMGHVVVAVNRYIHGMDPQEALDQARVFPEDGEVLFEAALPLIVQEDLRKLGHRLKPAVRPLGGGQAIAIDRRNGVLTGGSDFRKDGMAVGY
jgi:gamma-glutamyltranspeptidase/glutathione hydrolase